MATTTNFGWETPDDTDLVKDGAAAMRTLGSSIDTSFVDLKGGTTGQVLAKASGTDLDFTWVAQDDSNAIQNAIVDAKGDLIAATAADTPARLAVGTNGQVLTADSTAATGLAWATVSVPDSLGYAAGKNKIINGDFGIWQRGTTFSNPNDSSYTSDRWIIQHDGTGATRTISQQTFTPGSAPVSGYESQYFLQYAVSGGTSNTYQQIEQRIEDVRTFAGQTVTFSFWAKGDAARTINILNNRNFGSGGSTADQSSIGSTFNITTSWARYSVTATLASVAGKTIGAGSYSSWILRFAAATAQTIQIWGVQVEAGSTATAFQTATGTIQGELAACQRYFQVWGGNVQDFVGSTYSTTTGRLYRSLPVTMRIAPTATFPAAPYTNYINELGTANRTPTSLATSITGTTAVAFDASGMTGATAFRPIDWNTTATIQYSSEL